MTTTESTINNGVNVQALLDARAALRDAPEGAQFTWRAAVLPGRTGDAHCAPQLDADCFELPLQDGTSVSGWVEDAAVVGLRRGSRPK